jgi:hypothetical protein
VQKPPMAKVKRQLLIAPGKEVLQAFIQENASIFNLSEIERQCKLPNGSFRHIRAGTNGRDLTSEHYKKLQEVLLPTLTQLVFILQNYGQMHQLPIEY